MATRSRIGYKLENGKVESVYCHFDGYPDHNGVILLKNYSTIEKIKELIKLGDLSCLCSEIGEKHDFDDHKKDWCKFYGRDREESDVGAIISYSEEDFLKIGEAYNYLFKNNQWFYRGYETKDKLLPLIDWEKHNQE